ncbi:phage repressor protein C with HTH and peptisase S24 domain [Bradyrhizobium diazoefficiens]|jgi:phage repressor protein C with HTH and peptisase S24 domain|uniref:Transcriptional regulator n=2 Tax=Bradyrhizobium diazoefficiens TaxID=1355477 RepID=A0A0E4FT75_9BRAD|nr:helix-turn-helix transcriptional regulator [Bradyrhizobium diazoefficiens]MBP1096745.1 phage repressor protein C with HTH and peptisase S24 domain [Bradyrhizobium japonicum]APO49748.1 DNA-binding protein [Bradyrhizobium diazoefficiens]KGJ65593.1 putative Peptidase [Bradyrhizobium diazoefficiens SEMIA 5080]KOY05159.1 DNA-binding protein [Bradyrhizobium diazoefficiens]MBR0862998.1 helix-turn-helix transcriptional regulator [Bradyrhizobium diazoefficiens]
MVRQAKAQRILTHDQIWVALDRLAARAGLSPSGLAKRAGLDPTTFNRSKRVTSDGRERWPSTESIAKALAAAGASIDVFAGLISDETGNSRSVPLLGLAQAGASGAFDETGLPSGKGWTELALPTAEDSQTFALEIAGDALAPTYRNGDVILVSPGTPIRKGDRVVVTTKAGEVTVATLKRRTAKALDLLPLDASQAERTIAAGELAWVARIVWASQ